MDKILNLTPDLPFYHEEVLLYVGDVMLRIGIVF